MSNDLIDYQDNTEFRKIQLVRKCKKYALILFSGLMILEIIHPYVIPSILIGDVEISIYGLLLLLFYVFIILLLTKELHAIAKDLTAIQISLIVAIVCFIVEFIYKIFQNLFFHKTGFDLEYILIFKISLFIGSFAFFISLIKTYGLKGQSRTIPVLLFIAFLILFKVLNDYFLFL